MHEAELDLAEALPAELGRQVRGPQPAALDLLLQRRVDAVERRLVELVRRPVSSGQISSRTKARIQSSCSSNSGSVEKSHAMVSPSSGVAIAVGRHRSRGVPPSARVPEAVLTLDCSVLVRASLALVLVAALVAGCGGGGRHDVRHDRGDAARRGGVRRLPAPGPRRRARGRARARRAPARRRPRPGRIDRRRVRQPEREQRVRLAALRPRRRARQACARSSSTTRPPAARTRCWPRPAGCAPTARGAWCSWAASIGGRAVVTAAARGGPRRVDAVVSLSGERILGAQPDLLADARRLRVPTLWVSSENDAYTKFATETRQLYRGGAAGTRAPDRLLVVGGADHGIDLLTGPQARRVVPDVTRFIRRG